jgi:predicted dehydrogenase
MDELRVAVVGVGDVAQRDYLPEFHRLAGRARLELVCSRSAAGAARVAEDFRAARSSDDWRDALGESIDAVVNLTPAPAHGEINLAAVRAGKHLYSEKPVARDRDEGRRIAEAAAASGAVVVAAPSVMLFPQVQRAAELLASGLIGTVHSVRSLGTSPPPPWAGYDSDHSPFFSAEVGSLSDMGVYPLHAVTGLLGPAVTVAAMSDRTRGSFTVAEGPYAGRRVAVESDDNWQVVLRLARGTLATVQSGSCIGQPLGPDLELNGELGTIALSLIEGSHPVRIFTADRGWFDEPVAHARPEGPDHLLGIEHLVDCIEHRRAPVVNLDHALHVVDIRAAAAVSSRTRSFVDINSGFSPLV